MTINISLPKNMYEDARKLLAKRGYASISELVRDALREVIYPDVTENGFTREFEEEVLKAAAEPRSKDIVLKNKKDIENYFKHLKVPKKKK